MEQNTSQTQPFTGVAPSTVSVLRTGAPVYPLAIGLGASKYPSSRSGHRSDDDQSLDSLGSPETTGDDDLTTLEFQIVVSQGK